MQTLADTILQLDQKIEQHLTFIQHVIVYTFAELHILGICNQKNVARETRLLNEKCSESYLSF